VAGTFSIHADLTSFFTAGDDVHIENEHRSTEQRARKKYYNSFSCILEVLSFFICELHMSVCMSGL
jgi:hypothetical protein